MAWDAEIVVVGAGPAGCATALGLAARGHEVLVVDREPLGRDKVCGEGLMPHGVAALRRLGVGLPEAGRPFVGIGYHAGGHSAYGRFPGGRRGLGVRRLELDHHLAAAAAAHPRIEVRSGVRVRGAVVAPGDVRIASEDGELRGRALVAADGLRSGLRAALGLERPTTAPLRFGVRGHLEVERVPDHVEVFASPMGELYVTPVGSSTINVAVLCGKEQTRRLRGAPDASFLDLVGAWPEASELMAGAVPVSRVGTTGPLRRATADVVADSTVLVGDAAGFVDAVTGEGMSVTLLSAEIASEVLSRALRRGRLAAPDLRPYASRRAALARDLYRMTEVVVWGLRRPRLASWFVRELSRRPRQFDRLLAVATTEAPLWRLIA